MWILQEFPHTGVLSVSTLASLSWFWMLMEKVFVMPVAYSGWKCSEMVMIASF